jgi:excisionase family DNA binding protein
MFGRCNMARLRLYTVSEVAKALGVSRGTVDALLKRGELGYYRIGQRGVRISEAELEAYLARIRHGAPMLEPEEEES